MSLHVAVDSSIVAVSRRRLRDVEVGEVLALTVEAVVQSAVTADDKVEASVVQLLLISVRNYQTTV